MSVKTTLAYLFFLLSLAVTESCRKNPRNEIGLPPLTTEGKNTFGCKVDDQIFLPKSSSGTSPITCAYQHLYQGSSGYVFVVAANFSRPNDCRASTVRIYLDSISLNAGISYPLRSIATGKHEGLYFFTNDCGTTANQYVTNDEAVGAVTITHFDDVKGIAAGTFWFNAVNEVGDTIQVTDGRFDMEYFN